MRANIAALVVVGSISMPGSVSAAGQAVWDESVHEGGVELRLRNAEGAAIVLQCLAHGIGVGVAFAEPLEGPARMSMRAIPGERHNFAVTPVAANVVQIDGTRGLDFLLNNLRSVSRIAVRISGRQASFDVFGSESVVQRCLQHQEDVFRGPSPAIGLSFKHPTTLHIVKPE